MSTRSHTNPIRRAGAALAVLALIGTMLFAATSASAAPVPQARGTARGAVLELETSVPVPPPPGTLVTGLPAFVDALAVVSDSNSAIDTGGIHETLGDLFADGSAVPQGVDVAGVSATQFAMSDSHAPTDEALPDTATKASAAAQGVLTATGLSSESNAADSGDALSDNTATVGTAELLPSGDPQQPRPVLDATALTSAATVDQIVSGVDGDPSADSTASADATLAAFEALPIIGAIEGVNVDAHALADGAAGVATTDCNIVLIAGANPGDPPLLEVPCDHTLLKSAVEPAVDASPITNIDFGTVTETAGATASIARVTAVTLELWAPGDDKTVDEPITRLRLGIAEAESHRYETDDSTATPCGFPVMEFQPSSGSAQGYVARARDLQSQVEADVALSEARIDEAGLIADPDVAPSPARSDQGAEATGVVAQVEAFPAPNPDIDSSDLIELLDAHADAPADESESTGPVSVALPPPTSGVGDVNANAASVAANATTDGPMSLRDPAADAMVEVESLSADIPVDGSPLPITLDAEAVNETVSSSASSEKTGPNEVTSMASQLIEDFSSTVTAGPPVGTVSIGATVVRSVDTTAIADGTPGGASTSADVTITEVTVSAAGVSETITLFPDTDNDGVPDYQEIEIADPITNTVLAKVFIGEQTRFEAADGTEASISINPIRVIVPGDENNPFNEVIIGHTEAHAKVPEAGANNASAVITKELDENVEDVNNPGGEDFDDDPVTMAAHQKFWWRICVGNTGTTTLNGLQVVDVVDPLVRIVLEPPGPPAEFTLSGNTLTSDPFSLPSGGEKVFYIFAEVDPRANRGTVVNIATLTGGGLPDQDSNPVTFTIGYERTQPALRIAVRSSSWDNNTKILTGVVVINNHRRGGPAFGAHIDQITINTPNVTLLTPLPQPNPAEDIPSGGSSSPIQLDFHVPDANSPPVISLIFRERGRSESGEFYAFD